MVWLMPCGRVISPLPCPMWECTERIPFTWTFEKVSNHKLHMPCHNNATYVQHSAAVSAFLCLQLLKRIVDKCDQMPQ